MRFNHKQLVKIHSTCSELDGQIVSILGLAMDFSPASGSIYIIGSIHYGQFGDNSAMLMTESCLTECGKD